VHCGGKATRVAVAVVVIIGFFVTAIAAILLFSLVRSLSQENISGYRAIMRV
jgi:uncharacterized oligopeptide transporter (OPT) family protein